MSALNALGLVMLVGPAVMAGVMGMRDGPRTAGALVGLTSAVAGYFALAGCWLAL